jgi:WD40 repeat protein
VESAQTYPLMTWRYTGFCFGLYKGKSMRNRLVAVMLIAALALNGVSEQRMLAQGGLPTDTAVITANNADQLEKVARLGRGWIGSLRFYDAENSEDEVIIAAGTAGVWRYEAGSTSDESSSDEPLYPPSGVVVSSTGRYVVETELLGLNLLNVATGDVIRLPQESSTFGDVAFTPDDSLMISLDPNLGAVHVWELDGEAGELRTTLTIVSTGYSYDSLSISPDGTRFAAAFTRDAAAGSTTPRRVVVVWDVARGREIAEFELESDEILPTDTTFSPDSESVAVAFIGGVRVWDIDSGASTRLSLPPLPASGGANGDFRIFDSVVFVDDGNRVASAWTDSTPNQELVSNVTVWDLASGDIVAEVGEMKGYNRSLTANADGTKVAAYSYEGSIFTWDMEGAPVVITSDHPAGAEIMHASPNGNTLAVGAFDRAVRLWDVQSEELTRSFFPHNRDVAAIAYNEDGTLASASYFDTVVYEDDEYRDLDLSTGDILALNFAGDQVTQITSVSHGQATISTTDYTTDDVYQFTLPITAQYGVLSGDGTRAAVYNATDGIVIFDVSYGDKFSATELTRIEQPDHVSVMLLPETDLLITVNAQITSAYNIKGKRAELVWQFANNGAAYVPTFSPDGSLLAAGTEDGDVLMWDVETQKLVATVEASDTPIYGIAFSNDGRLLFVGVDTTIQVWGYWPREVRITTRNDNNG